MSQKIEEIPGWPVDDLYLKIWETNSISLSKYGAIASFVLAVPLIVIGALMTFIDHSSFSRGVLSEWHVSPAVPWGLALVGAGLALHRVSKTPPRWVQIFRNSTDRIVWLYITTVHITGAYRGTRKELNIFLDDRSKVVLWAASDDADAALTRFASLVPQAAVGYSVENRTAFERDPRSLLRPKGVRRGIGLPG